MMSVNKGRLQKGPSLHGHLNKWRVSNNMKKNWSRRVDGMEIGTRVANTEGSDAP